MRLYKLNHFSHSPLEGLLLNFLRRFYSKNQNIRNIKTIKLLLIISCRFKISSILIYNNTKAIQKKKT